LANFLGILAHCAPARFEPTMSEGKRPQTFALHRTTTGTGE